MDKYKFLKEIYDKDSIIPENNNLYSKDNIEVQTVLKLNEEEQEVLFFITQDLNKKNNCNHRTN